MNNNMNSPIRKSSRTEVNSRHYKKTKYTKMLERIKEAQSVPTSYIIIIIINYRVLLNY